MRAKSVNIHASCVLLGRAARFGASRSTGVLLLGESGAGKSDLVLRLIALGAELVADDRVDLCVRRGRLVARPPGALAGMMEIRGLGIVELPYTDEIGIRLAVELTGRAVERMPRHRSYAPKGLKLPASARPPLIRIAAFEASAAEKLIAAAAAFAHRLFRDTVKPR